MDKIVITLKENDKGEWEFSIKSNTEIKRDGFEDLKSALTEAQKMAKRFKEYKEELKNQLELF